MNKREAIRAMCDGKKVRREFWHDAGFLKMDEDGGIVDEDGFADDINEHNDDDDWQIYEEPKPKVTYEDAVAAKVVRIYWPPEASPNTNKKYDRGQGWMLSEFMAFDLADRKGYRMEVVE